MFDTGVPHDQFHQFIASSRNPIHLPLAFPLHGVSSSPPPSFSGFFDPYSPAVLPQLQLQQSGVQQLHHRHRPTNINDEQNEKAVIGTHVRVVDVLSTNLKLDDRRQISIDDSWSNDEILALLRIRSSLENWLPDFTWEHVSRKLAELGFQRSAEKCKEKFEEESRPFNNMNYNSELDEIYQGENPPLVEAPENIDNLEEADRDNNIHEDDKMDEADWVEVQEAEKTHLIAQAAQELEEELLPMRLRNKKRRRREKIAMWKGFCEALVKKIMAQQEELNNKIIQDLLKREEEYLAREEAWRKEDDERMKRESETRLQDRAIAGDRQTKILELLKMFANDDQNLNTRIDDFLKLSNTCSSTTSSSSEIMSQNYLNIGNPISQQQQLSDHSKVEAAATSSNVNFNASHQNPTTLSPTKTHHSTTIKPNDVNQVQANEGLVSRMTNSRENEGGERDNIGKRWPRDEVLALINLRRSLNNSNNNEDNNKETLKGPLWERISQGMLELGYKRSAKRCKEKWENINKYFRKTKDNKKKRSMDSRACPYFHQLSSFYSQGTPAETPTDIPKNHQT